MRKNTIKQKMAAVLCMAMLFGQTMPAALGEDLVTLITPAGDSATSSDQEQGGGFDSGFRGFGSGFGEFGYGFPGGFAPGFGFGGFEGGFEGGFGGSDESDADKDDDEGSADTGVSDSSSDAGSDSQSAGSGFSGGFGGEFGYGFPGGFTPGFGSGFPGGFGPGFGGSDDENSGTEDSDNTPELIVPITPPSSGGAEQITPPSSGGAEQITPPSSGGAELITPPSSGGAEQITPPSSGGAEQITPPSSGGAELITPPSSGGAELITPPSSGGAELITPPSSGGAELITPPSSGGAEQITPPSSGGAELITPPSSGSSSQTVKSFTLLPMVYFAQVSVMIDGADSREIEIELLDHNGKEVASSSIIGNGMVRLGEFADGSYTVRAQYVTPIQNADGSFDFKTVTEKITVRRGLEEQPEQEKPIDIQAKIEKGKDYIIITVTKANEQEMLVSVEGQADKRIVKGVPVRYEGLTPGKSYGVEIDYVDYVEGAKRFTETVTLDQPATLSKIWITAVTPGINKLTVSGMAAPGQQLILTTKPAAAADVYAMADIRGVFRAEIACAAGVYTAVTVKYSADMSNSYTTSGNWVVSAPVAKPTLTVDTIDTASTTVIAKTTAGVIVEIKTGDYTQKVTADENGIVRFSLPHTYAKNTEFTFVVYYGNWQFFVQTVRVSGVEYLGTLEYGDEGDAVRKLTRRLAALGYPVEETGRYGSTVREAVRLFQRANGLDDDGIAGKKTQQALFSVGAIAYGAGKYPTLVRGDRDYALIYTLQQRLKDLGYYTIKVDGIFGSGTQRAVREFQQVNGLSVTGKADNATQQLLYSSAAKPAGSSSGIPSSYETLSRSGKYKSAVVPLQKRLRELGYYSGNIDGYFGSQTYRAVRNFQSRNGLTVTGVADAYTQQILYSASAKTYSGSTASSGSTSSGYRLLYWGCRGDAVKRLQNALINAGYKSIVRTADGIFGQWTYDAVRAYQKDHGLAVDGIAGKNTQNSLYGTKY